ncbi:uncharacterized protein LOC115449598 [Manduca sexta]|uniref:uncharacterized protein LOC115449598 n=1 Tax=Manduca sexta TaxID=7130 RepID=UPI00188FC378|nr:uncharacterized protein LOC115449598 [Manduca sexta]
MLIPLTLLLVISQLHEVLNIPLYKRASDTKTPNDIPILITHPTHIQHILKPIRQKKSHNIPVIPIPHHLLIPSKLHVIPAQSNVRHSSVHTNVNHLITNDNIKIPVVTQTVSHSATNVTHPGLIPILIPIHHNLVQVHDLTVIPLQNKEKLGQYRTEKKEEELEEQNRYRTYYGGFGTGLFFGGHGAGHGFYHAYGK